MKKIGVFYRKEWRDFKRHHARTFCMVLILFVIIVAFFSIVYQARPDSARKALSPFIHQVQKSMKLTGFALFAELFKKNMLASTLALLLGLVPGLFLPGLVLFANGRIMAAVIVLLHAQKKASLPFMLAGILPHGVIEIPAFIFSITLGVYQSKKAYRGLRPGRGLPGGYAGEEPLPFSRLARSLVAVVAPLLFVAALIEVFATPLFVRWLTGIRF